MVALRGITRAKVSARWVRTLADRAIRTARAKGDAAVLFVTEREIARLNASYRGKRGPTDVLSFPAGAAGDLGDVFISVVSVRRKARLRGMAAPDYLALVIIHGILHLAGFDHVRAKDAQRMERLERRILHT